MARCWDCIYLGQKHDENGNGFYECMVEGEEPKENLKENFNCSYFSKWAKFKL